MQYRMWKIYTFSEYAFNRIFESIWECSTRPERTKSLAREHRTNDDANKVFGMLLEVVRRVCVVSITNNLH